MLPTLSHRRNVDFFIDGEQYDQKVSKSVGEAFKKEYGPNWRQVAIARPGLVAKSLYANQDEGRFGRDPRLLVVNLDENIGASRIKQVISETDLTNPLEIDFEFKYKSGITKHYKTKCFVILIFDDERSVERSSPKELAGSIGYGA